MFKFITILSIFVITTTGCNVQRGRFVTSGDEFFPFLSPGGLIIVKGSPTTFLIGGASGNDQNLLYVLFISPEFPRLNTSGSIIFTEYSTRLSHMLNDGTRDIPVSFEWDRQNDAILVGSQKFSRVKGNIFIVQLNAKGKVVCRQMTGLGPHSSSQRVLEFVRQQSPNDELIRNLTLMPAP
jgi:hypothetical protein